jgi:hypothetical protein
LVLHRHFYSCSTRVCINSFFPGDICWHLTYIRQNERNIS